MGIVAVVAAVLSIEATGGFEVAYICIAIVFALWHLVVEVTS
jgi:hypothetical protein